MTTLIATREESPRPSIGRPADNPTDPKHRIVSKYRKDGSLLKIKVQESLILAMDDAKRQLENASGKDFSYAFLARRALDLYMTKFAAMTPEQVADEVIRLKNNHR